MEIRSTFKPDNRLINILECRQMVPVANSTWWAGVRDGTFPKPVKIRGNTFWRYSDVLNVVEGKAETGNKT